MVAGEFYRSAVGGRLLCHWVLVNVWGRNGSHAYELVEQDIRVSLRYVDVSAARWWDRVGLQRYPAAYY